MNRLLKGGLALGGAVLTLGAMRRALNPEPRYAAWEKPSYEKFEKKILIVGGGFGGFTTAKKLTSRPPNAPPRTTSTIFFFPSAVVPALVGGSIACIDQPSALAVPLTWLRTVLACASCVPALFSAATRDA